jgi:hypothetical protein
VFNRNIGTPLLVVDDVDATLVANRRANNCNDDIVDVFVVCLKKKKKKDKGSTMSLRRVF